MPEFGSLLRTIVAPLLLVVLFAIGLAISAALMTDGRNEAAVPFFQLALNMIPQVVGAIAVLALAGEIFRSIADRKKPIHTPTIEAWILLVLACAALSQGGFGAPLAIAAWFVARVLAEKWSPKMPAASESES